MNTPTPRTHAVVVLCNYGKERVTADFARTLERELAVAQNWVEHHSQHADDLIAQNVELRAKVERLKKQIKDDNRSYGCELRDPNGTIWEQATKDRARAERAEAGLATERARLDDLVADINDACITLASAKDDCDDYAMQNTEFKLTAVCDVLLQYIPNAAMKKDAK